MSTLLTTTQVRDSFADTLDRAGRGLPVGIDRRLGVIALLPAGRLAEALRSSTLVPRPELFCEEGVWVASIPDAPVAAEAGDMEAAIDELVEALREFADDWSARLHTAPNHARWWALVQMVSFSTDEQLKNWVTRTG
ncbi:MAG: type II toxin-antitoxin system HicB family antitoxin [Euzebya sp.]